jgi:dipeptidyl-peptidase-4
VAGAKIAAMFKSCLKFALIYLLAASFGFAQDRLLTLEELYEPDHQVDFDGPSPVNREWLPDGNHYLERQLENRWVRVDAESGDSEPLLEPDRLQAAAEKLAGFSAEKAGNLARKSHVEMARDERNFLINWGNDLFAYDREQNRLTRLTSDRAEEEEAQLSPSGEMAAFVKGNNLWVVALDGSLSTRLTEDGSSTILNGKLDWVYQEEVYGRGRFRGFWWSPDSSSIAFLQLNELDVPKFTVVDHRPVQLKVERTWYPKPGDPNPKARLGMVSVIDGELHWADLERYFRDEPLLVRVKWTPDSNRVMCQIQNRVQTWLDLAAFNPSNGEETPVFREESPAWVNVLGEPEWMDDGSFLWESERDGFRHIYHYSADGKLLGRVTSGEWEVTSFEGVDEKAGWVYFSGKADGAPQQQLYRAHLDGTGRERITKRSGFHSVKLNSESSLYLDSWSDISTPRKVSLHRADGSLVRELGGGDKSKLAEYRLGEVEFFTVPARDGFEMEAMWIKPPDFSPERRYPVLISVYGGPQAPTVRNSWGGKGYLWHQMLAQKGYLVFYCDNRSASGKGAKYSWPIHHRLGEVELSDLEDAVNWLKEKPFIDGSRIGVWGWSYGGYFTSYALTHSAGFKVGIAGAPVTDWHLYDSIYTERYMGLPQTNAPGYRSTSVLEAASNLEGHLLLIHGTIDDNVHLQNSIKLINELENAGKMFDLMLYPGARHGVRSPRHVYHLRSLITRFILDNL